MAYACRMEHRLALILLVVSETRGVEHEALASNVILLRLVLLINTNDDTKPYKKPRYQYKLLLGALLTSGPRALHRTVQC